MKIIVEGNKNERQSPIVQLDLSTCHYPYAIREALELALELDGYDKSTIDDVFGRSVDAKCIEQDDEDVKVKY